MSKLIRRTIGIKKRGTALIVALQLTFITLLSLVSFVGGSTQQSAKAPVGSQIERACSRRRLARRSLGESW